MQTDSSVFGISLKKARLLELGLAIEQKGVLHPTDKGLRAVVEVFFPGTGRLARLPLVDIGPSNTGAARTAIADLTVAAAAFLQKLTEKDIKKLDNIAMQARVIAQCPAKQRTNENGQVSVCTMDATSLERGLLRREPV
jgi:hypothetical protein